MVATDPFVGEVDAIQYRLIEGPCISAAAERRTMRSGSLGADPRWPTFGPAGRRARCAERAVAAIAHSGRGTRRADCLRPRRQRFRRPRRRSGRSLRHPGRGRRPKRARARPGETVGGEPADRAEQPTGRQPSGRDVARPDRVDRGRGRRAPPFDGQHPADATGRRRTNLDGAGRPGSAATAGAADPRSAPTAMVSDGPMGNHRHPNCACPRRIVEPFLGPSRFTVPAGHFDGEIDKAPPGSYLARMLACSRDTDLRPRGQKVRIATCSLVQRPAGPRCPGPSRREFRQRAAKSVAPNGLIDGALDSVHWVGDAYRAPRIRRCGAHRAGHGTSDG